MLQRDPLPDVDLIIDATASRAVAAALERSVARASRQPWIASLLTDATATRGAVFIAGPRNRGALLDVGRRVALRVCSDPQLRHFYDTFFAPARTDALFQPEPGCSAATFVGSAADAAAISAILLTLACEAMATDATAAGRLVALPHAELKSGEATTATLDWHEAWLPVEDPSGYVVRINPQADQRMRTLASASPRWGRRRVETGGLLFGEWNDAARVVWVDHSGNPPKDSRRSPTEFVCGLRGTAKEASRLRASSAGTIICVGVWHTHPDGAARPSQKGLATMQRIMESTESASMRSLMVILGGPSENPTPAAFVTQLDQDNTV